jgi:hypothetical protein
MVRLHTLPTFPSWNCFSASLFLRVSQICFALLVNIIDSWPWTHIKFLYRLANLFPSSIFSSLMGVG